MTDVGSEPTADATVEPLPLVLASSSRYRRELLERLGIPFAVDSPDIDETPNPGESARELVTRLSLAKARVVARRWPRALIIGSDQAATFAERILGKPGTVQAAVRQLLAFSGRRVDFLTGVVVLNSATDRFRSAVDITTARFRTVSASEVLRYVEEDKPLDCAGGIRFEGLGPLLLNGVDTADPTAAIGLPLIALGALLRAEGVNPLGPATRVLSSG
ncbi:MAG: Maf family protein [Gammaproteobacteria bacterium]|nr:Maf family protein [Gammaproteobacteria bacterium]